MIKELVGTRFGVRAIKNIVTPLQRWLYKSTGGEMLVVGGSNKKPVN